MAVLYVALGSALGGVCRFVVSRALNGQGLFPWGTLGVNVAGSLLIGLLGGFLAKWSGSASAAVRLFAVVGFCGGFTTFSTFSNEAMTFLQRGQFGLCCCYVVVSVLAGLLAVWVGLKFA